MRYLKFFLIQLKRTAKQATGVFPAAMLLFACIFAAALLVAPSDKFGSEGARYRIGVVGDINDNYLGFGFTAIRTLDSSRYVVDFETMSEDEALSAFRKGDLIAVIKIPEGFAESVAHGKNLVPVGYISNRGLKGIDGYIMDEFADVVSRLVTSAQTAFFAVDDVATAVGATGDISVYLKEFNLKIIDYILNRGKLVETKEIGVSNGLPMSGYYFCALLLLFVFLMGLGSVAFFSGRNRALGRWMQLKGIGAAGQIACEYLSYLVLMTLCMIIPVVIAGAAFDLSAMSGLEISAGRVIAMMLPVLMMVCAMNYLFYEAMDSVITCFLVQFLTVLLMAYLSGYIYPVGFFPDAIAAIGRMLPTGVALSFLSSGVRGEGTMPYLLLITAMSLVFLAGTMLLRRRSIVKESV